MIFIGSLIYVIPLYYTYFICRDNGYPEWKAYLCSLLWFPFWILFLIYFGIKGDLWK